MKFTFAVAKMSKADIGRAQGHNLRLHETSSQLPKRAWFTESPMHTKVEWDQGKLDAASALAKRKDAVVAIEFIIQVGNQTDWREDPTPECPEGPPIERDLGQFFAPFGEQVKAWADQEFGPENVVSIQLHMDESTPHFHVIATPIKDGKLQAKAWLDGGRKLAGIRRRCHATINEKIPCVYTPNGLGGNPHRPDLRAGTAPVPTLIEKMSGHAKAQRLERENAALQEENTQLKQLLFSRQKGRYSADNVELAQQATAEAQKAQSELQRVQGEVKRLTMALDSAQSVIGRQGAEIDKLKGYNRTLSEQNNELEEKLQDLQPKRSRGKGMGL